LDTLYKILDLMWKSGLSEMEFCKKTGINRSAVTDWKKGKTKSYLKHISKIAETLGVTEEYLLSDTKAKAAPQEQPLSEKQETVLKLSEQLTDEDLKKLIDYAELLRKAKNQ